MLPFSQEARIFLLIDPALKNSIKENYYGYFCLFLFAESIGVQGGVGAGIFSSDS